MNVPILYHYPMSPYSEKLRLTMGLSGTRWLSVSVAAYPPRPELARLVGGYRRIPVLQLGAHFYCDTRLAFAALMGDESRCWSLSETDEALRRRAEQEVFFAVVAGASPYRAVRFLSGELGVSGLIRFVRDRIAMTRGATIVRPDAKTARQTVLSFINQLADRLAGGAFLSGPRVGYLDLCCFHPLWMATQIDSSKMAAWPSPVRSWFAKVEQLGHGTRAVASTQLINDAIADDQAAFSAGVVAAPFVVSEPVSVRPADYARDETPGRLIHLDDRSVVLEREPVDGTRVYCHFPRQGFELNRLSAG